MYQLVADPIDVAAVRASVTDPRHGAVLVFEGVARDDGGLIELSYEAYAELAVPVMQRIGADAATRFGAAVSIVHRTGSVALCEPSLVVAVATPHRAECYEASRWVLEEIKAHLPVWKKEITEDGSEWKANAAGREPSG